MTIIGDETRLFHRFSFASTTAHAMAQHGSGVVGSSSWDPPHARLASPGSRRNQIRDTFNDPQTQQQSTERSSLSRRSWTGNRLGPMSRNQHASHAVWFHVAAIRRSYRTTVVEAL